MEEGDDLSDLLSLMEEESAAEAPPVTSGLKEITNFKDFLQPRDEDNDHDLKVPAISSSTIHSGDTDSSEDEDNRNFEEQNLTSSGRGFKKLITSNEKEKSNRFSLGSLKGLSQQNAWDKKPLAAGERKFKDAVTASGLTGKLLNVADRDFFLEPVSGIRVVNPLVSQLFMQERSEGRQTVPCSMVKRKYESNSLQDDWLTTGVVVSASKKVSQKSKEYLVWTISDLKHDMASVTVFLFSGANTAFTSAAKGTVVGILNPNVLPPSSAKYDLILSVNDAQRVLVIGSSKDYGICRSKTLKNEPCTNFVNTNTCPYCPYHMSKEHKKLSGKPSFIAGKTAVMLPSPAMRKTKIAKEHLAQLTLPQANNKNIISRDRSRMQALMGSDVAPEKKVVEPALPRFKNVTRAQQIMKYTKLGVQAKDVKPAASVSKLSGVFGNKAGEKKPAPAKVDLSALGNKSTPTLNKFNSIELGDLRRKPIINSHDRAKMSAMQLVRQKGPIKKVNPNLVKKAASAPKVVASLKRKVNSRGEEDEDTLRKEFDKKKAKFMAMIETGSQHQDLIASAEQEAEDKYFNNMETKEKIEDKMLNTHKLEAKAVQCSQCKYTALSRSEFCRKQGHQVKIVQATKRFFKCKGCQNRTCVLTIVPTIACSNCGQNQWEKAGMIKDKIVTTETLKITAGDREVFNPAHINSLVP